MRTSADPNDIFTITSESRLFRRTSEHKGQLKGASGTELRAAGDPSLADLITRTTGDDHMNSDWLPPQQTAPQPPEPNSSLVPHILSMMERIRLLKHTHTHSLSPWADPHEGDGGTGEENCQEEEGFPPPDIRQGSDQWSRQKRQEALKEHRGSERDDRREDPSRKICHLATNKEWRLTEFT